MTMSGFSLATASFHVRATGWMLPTNGLRSERCCPPLRGKRVVELGCGFGQLTRWLAAEGATSVIGIDLSEKMLARAIAETKSPAVIYQRANLDELTLPAHCADVVVSSMTLHYLEDFARIGRVIHEALVPGGSLVFSVEHPEFQHKHHLDRRQWRRRRSRR